jgi:hypothetical protein
VRILGYHRNIHVQNLGWCKGSAAPGGLSALELVQRPVDLPLYSGLVTGELGEGVRFVGVPDEGSAKRGGLRISRGLQLSNLGECLFVLPFVRYRRRRPQYHSYYVIERIIYRT